jgi:hypothetical protein
MARKKCQATGTVTNVTPIEEAEDKDANAADGEEEVLEDNVPSVPNDDIDLLLVNCTTAPTVTPTIATAPPVLSRTPTIARTPTVAKMPASRESTSVRPLVW